ncbi:Arm DNA-binding domain-containing protein [Yersinia alsatica]|nr:Arm DNA-binding domain-containing protein [Yersinia alsatica]CNI88946.1 integrase [Yersinia frederiksenii]
MALSDVKVRTAKPEAKAYKLTDGEGMVLLVHPSGRIDFIGLYPFQ